MLARATHVPSRSAIAECASMRSESARETVGTAEVGVGAAAGEEEAAVLMTIVAVAVAAAAAAGGEETTDGEIVAEYA